MDSPGNNGVRNSPTSSVSSSPDQHHQGCSPPSQPPPAHNNQQQQQQHDQLHIVVEPQPDGLTNFIHLINPATGVVLSSILAEHGAHIEIQPGFVFRVPYPQVHGYPPYAAASQQQLTSGGGFVPSSMMSTQPPPPPHGTVPSAVGPPAFINSACPIHGSPSQLTSHSNGDDRLERRREKLQRKLREKQKPHCCCVPVNDPNLMYINADNSYHPPPPRGSYHKATAHQGRRSQYQGNRGSFNANNNDAATHACNRSDDLEQDSMDDKSDVDIVVVPKVEVIDCANLKISWSESITNNNHLSSHKFELQMACNGSQFRTIYMGGEDDYIATSLSPATDYSFRLCALVGDKRGNFSEVISQRTSPSVPDKPFPPRVIQKTKTSLLLKWSVPKDGGKPIVSYQLQWNKGDGSNNFEDLIVSNLRQYKLSHGLPAGTPCKFRLYASNELGQSEPSQLLECYTSASPPEAVGAPDLVKSGTAFLTVSWKEPENNGAPITDYKLEMEQSESGYGFMAVYRGEHRQYTCRNLLRNTSYKFRVFACNSQGVGKCSGVSSFKTNPEAASRMEKPKMIGKSKTHSFLIGWDPPKDDGGSPVFKYMIEMDDGKSGDFKDIYCGPLLEYNAEALTPGRTYRVRAASETAGGKSAWSALSYMTTTPVCPGKPEPPRLSKKSKVESNSLHLEWDCPSNDGGAPVVNYVVRMGESSSFQDCAEVYHGSHRHCEIRELHPGSNYQFRLQANNKAGSSPPSDAITLKTAAGAPDAPLTPVATNKSHMLLRLEWQPPNTNGSPVMKYTLEQQKNSQFVTIYEGLSTSFDVKRGLKPATCYLFRVQAHSLAGTSPHSDIGSFMTSPAAPAGVSDVEVIKQLSDSVRLRWKRPEDHGSPIVGYNIEISGPSTHSQYVPVVTSDEPTMLVRENAEPEVEDELDDTKSSDGETNDKESMDDVSAGHSRLDKDNVETEVHDLTSDTAYRARIQAVNKIGTGPFSHSVQFVTTELPPEPPALELVSASYHSLKLKWGEANAKRQSSVLNFCLQMENSAGRFVDCYVGLAHSFSVGKVKELSVYKFRICATNDAGQGQFSQPASFHTKPQQPASVRDLSINRPDDDTVALTWSRVDALRSCDRIEYIVQESSRNHNKEFIQVYRGARNDCTLRSPASDIDMVYRIGAVRCLASTNSSWPEQPLEIRGQFINIVQPRRVVNESKPAPENGNTRSSEVTSPQEPSTKQISDSQVALCILGCFLGVCSIIAFLLWMFFS